MTTANVPEQFHLPSLHLFLPSENPNGIPSQSPGSRGPSRTGHQRYPGLASEENDNPNGVVANITKTRQTNTQSPQPRCGWECCWTMTQGGR